MEFIYELLEKEVGKLLSKIKVCENLEEKAELIGKKNLAEHSIRLLKKCDENGVGAGSIFTKLPRKVCDSPSSDYRIIEDLETDDNKYWTEVNIEGKRLGNVRLGEGDVVIEL
ncbi:hypothetical protein [Aliikangiella coralliicola]|uniref:Uncharacterized protein n=1 Tax=Aliikangiella coralliicola TaxID=2592383 RepID=A0A545UFP2_9GAMM|nr:hypothetical protein [Aliikangiella coralliicola]TQV88291.1 hypothetical protein FLL46_07115 [Aliikangiella coralliicola]